MSPRFRGPVQATPVEATLNIDIWGHIFNQLALLGYHKTLASCARLSKEHAEPALRRLYSQQFNPGSSWANRTSKGLWYSLISSVSFPEAWEKVPLTSHPYLTYVRRLDTHSLRAVLDRLDSEEELIQLADGLQDMAYLSAPTTSSLDWYPDYLAGCLVIGIICSSRSQGLRVTLKELTARSWVEMAPIVSLCRQLESLYLDFAIGLDGAADIINKRLPKLRHLTFVGSIDRGTDEVASCISLLKPDRLLSFKCAFRYAQSPIWEALAKQTELEELELQFWCTPPTELHLLTTLTNLTSLTLKSNDTSADHAEDEFRTWAKAHQHTMRNWLMSCRNLKNLHVFRLPSLIPAIADALSRLRLDRLHIYGTAGHEGFYRALKSQRLKYLFIGEWPLTHWPGEGKRRWLVVGAVCAMPCLRVLRLHTNFGLSNKQLGKIARHVKGLEKISFHSSPDEDRDGVLRALEGFKHLTSLTMLGRTFFRARELMQWIERTRCHLRPGGFSLSLPCQGISPWAIGEANEERTFEPCRERFREVLKFFSVWIRTAHGEWKGNDYEAEEERMFITLWGEVEGSTADLMMVDQPDILMRGMGAQVY